MCICIYFPHIQLVCKHPSMASSSSCSLSLFLFSLIVVFSFHLPQSHSAAKVLVQPKGSTGVHLPIRKNAASLQYYATFEMGTPDTTTLNRIEYSVKAVIDLGGQFLWFDCDEYNSTSYRPVPCGSSKCKAAKGSGCQGCNGSPRPGCTNNTCGSFAYNPFTNKLYAEGLGEDVMTVYSTNGLVVISPNEVPHFAFSCSDPSLSKGLAFGTNGMVGLARTQTSLPNQISMAFNLPRKFALCMPSSSETGLGDVFIGGGPYYMPPYTKDLSKSVTTTPLLINPVSTAPVYSEGDSSDEYFIDMKYVRVGGIRLGSFDASLLAIDKNGNGGTKLSTVTPYTILHTSIYRALLNKFVKTAASMNIKRVKSVQPFKACFSSKTISATSSTGPDVPIIDLVLQKGVYWRIYGGNSMVEAKKGVLCLGFVDGGSRPRTSVVLGGHQLENYLIEFDLASSMLGFSSSLLLHNTSCSHYRIFLDLRGSKSLML